MASKKCVCIENTENFTMVSLVQFFYKLEQTEEEVRQLMTYLTLLEFRQAVVYVQDAVRCSMLTEVLVAQGFAATAVHEVMSYKLRVDRLTRFKEMEMETANILVTSCCGHAMEFKNVDVCIMFDETVSTAVYNHRVASRRARKGLVINFITKQEQMAVLKQTEKLYNVTIAPLPQELYTSTYLDWEETVTNAL